MGICLRYSNDVKDAEDLLQETFIKVFHSLKQYKGNGDLGAWIRRIAINKAIEKWRKEQREKQIFETKDMEYLEETYAAEPEDQLALEELLNKIQSLPMGFRTIFNLYAIEGYKHKEISTQLGISEGTSKSQYARARAMLIKLLQSDDLGVTNTTTI